MVALLIRRSVKDVRIGMSTLSIVVAGEDNNAVFPLISPIRNFGNERELEPE